MLSVVVVCVLVCGLCVLCVCDCVCVFVCVCVSVCVCVNLFVYKWECVASWVSLTVCLCAFLSGLLMDDADLTQADADLLYKCKVDRQAHPPVCIAIMPVHIQKGHSINTFSHLPTCNLPVFFVF